MTDKTEIIEELEIDSSQIEEIEETEDQLDEKIDAALEEMEASEIVENLDVDTMVPNMQVTLTKEKECIVSDNVLLSLYDEILNNCRSDRSQADEILMNFINMVMNDGESSPAAKEAIVNMMKIKSDISDKMTKIADLETRIKLKDNDTYPRYMAAQQNNKIVFDDKRKFLKNIDKKLGKKNDK